MATPIFKGKTTNRGTICFGNFEQFTMYISTFEPDTEVEVIVRKPKKRRSEQQNKYFHKVIRNMYAEASGLDVEEAKEVLKSDILGFMTELAGRKYWIVPQTSKLTTVEFEEFNKSCRELAYSRYECRIPEPNEVVF